MSQNKRQEMENISIKADDDYGYKGKVYYDIKEKKFVQIRKTLITCHEDGFVCGDFCEYYSDSKTNICPQMLSEDYIVHNLVQIDLSNSRLFEHNGIGWRCKERKD